MKNKNKLEWQREWRRKNKDKVKEYSIKSRIQIGRLREREYEIRYENKLKEITKIKKSERLFLSNFFKNIDKIENSFINRRYKINIRKGYVMPDEQIEKIRKRVIEFWKDNEKLKERYRELRYRQVLPVKDTKIEVKIQNFLKELAIDFFTHQYIKDIKHGYQCDILINPQPNFMSERVTIIECDGDYWHGNTKVFSKNKLNEMQKKKILIDKIRTEELISNGFRLIRLWENEINSMDLKIFKEIIFNRTINVQQ